MGKPVKWFALGKMWEKNLEKKTFLIKGPVSLLKFLSGTVFRFCLFKPGFSVTGISTSNRLLQTTPLTIKNFLLTTKINLFLFLICEYLTIYYYIKKENLPHFNKFFSSFFSSASNASVGTCVATTSKWSFHLISITTQNWTGLSIPSPSLLLLHQIYWF